MAMHGKISLAKYTNGALFHSDRSACVRGCDTNKKTVF